MGVSKQVTVTTDFHSTEKNTIEVNDYRQLLVYQHSSEDLGLCSAQERNSHRFEGDGEYMITEFSFHISFFLEDNISKKWHSLPSNLNRFCTFRNNKIN